MLRSDPLFFKILPEARQLLLGFVFVSLLAVPPGYTQKRSGNLLRLEAGLGLVPVRNLKPDSGSLSQKSAYLRATVPVYRHFFTNTKQKRLLVLAFQDNLQYTDTRISFLSQPILQFQNQSNFSAILLSGRKNIWYSSLGTSVNADVRHVQDALILPLGSFLFQRRINSRWSYTLGGAYSFLFGQGLGLPVLGVRYSPKPGRQWTLFIPYRISYRVRHSPRYSSLVQARPLGGLGLIYTSAYSADKTQKAYYLRNRAFSFGYQGMYQFSKGWGLRFGLSFLLRRKIWISDERRGAFRSPENVYSGSVGNGLLWEIGLRFTPGKGSKDRVRKDSEAVPDPDFKLTEEDLENLDPQYFANPEEVEEENE